MVMGEDEGVYITPDPFADRHFFFDDMEDEDSDSDAENLGNDGF
jgi:hypothetical protein